MPSEQIPHRFPESYADRSFPEKVQGKLQALLPLLSRQDSGISDIHQHR